jgi:hypothetical protein
MPANVRSLTTSKAFPVAAGAELLDEELAALRQMSLEERGRLIESCCRSAAEILAGRRQCGLPDEQPAPWPASTFEFLKRCARAHRKP